MGVCPKENIQPRLYRAFRVIQIANIFLGIGNRSRGFLAGKLVGRCRVGGEGDVLGEIAQCVWVVEGGGGWRGVPDKVYGVIYGLDLVALEFTRPLSSFFLFTNFNT